MSKAKINRDWIFTPKTGGSNPAFQIQANGHIAEDEELVDSNAGRPSGAGHGPWRGTLDLGHAILGCYLGFMKIIQISFIQTLNYI